MESLPKHSILEWPPNALEDIRKIHNLDKLGRIEEAVTILEEWLQKQDHLLKKDFSKEYLERTLIASKGSVEKAKSQIDNLCTLKKLLPHFFMKHSPKGLSDILETAYLSMLPKMTNDFYRIYMIKFHAKVFRENTLLEFFQYNIMQCEYMKSHDYANGFIILYDLKETNLMDVVIKLNPIMLQQYMTILMEGFGARIKAIHLLTESKTIEVLIKTVKPFLAKKILDRIFLHKTIQELHLSIPKDLLPEDYEGNGKSLKNLAVEWLEELSIEKNVEYMKMMSKACTDETLRRSDKFNEEYMGMPGSFRHLKID